MLPPSTAHRRPSGADRSRLGDLRRRARSGLVLALTAALAATVGLSLAGAPAYAANPVTPGTYRGLGFDQCEAPSQSAMSTWIKKSPFRAAGIYISGNSRACRTQKNLSATWVRNQLAAGWHLMPITLGPQASCSSRYPRYGRSIDPTISANSAGTYAAARSQGALEARRAVAAARKLGIVPGSTLFYDLEAFNTARPSACASSALWFMSAWTTELHRYRYASGYYSSAASGIKLLDDARVRAGNPIKMPDQVWIADWNGKANTTSSYVRSDGWKTWGRAKQYRGGHNETWGGVRINIDSNYLDLRTPRLPGAAAPTPKPTPKPTPAPAPGTPAYTGSSLADPRCTSASINRTSYLNVTATFHTSLIVPLQCVLKQQRHYRYAVTGTWNTPTTAALHAFQRKVGHPVTRYASRGDWVALLSAGGSGVTLRPGNVSASVTQVQRALNAAGSAKLAVTGRYDTRTAAAAGRYQKSVGLPATRLVGKRTWAALKSGRR